MIDEEVETVLREIRERVIAQPLARAIAGRANGNQSSQLIALGETSPRSTEALARLNAHLTTTARAWDRLPPVFSNRTGTAGRIEVWIKARLKRFSRWFTWEQINFNAAVHHALGETLKTVTEQDAAIAAQSMQLAAARTEQRSFAHSRSKPKAMRSTRCAPNCKRTPLPAGSICKISNAKQTRCGLSFAANWKGSHPGRRSGGGSCEPRLKPARAKRWSCWQNFQANCATGIDRE